MSTQVTVTENGIQVEVTGTLPVTANQLDALNAADVPSATNQLLTRSAGDARYQATPIADSDVPSTIARDSEVTAAIGAHAAAVDPHGDRAYAASQAAARKMLTDYANVMVVDAGGNGDYTTLAAALAAITDDDASHVYNVFVFGAAADNSLVAARPFIKLHGSSDALTYPYSNPRKYTWQWNNQGLATMAEASDHITIFGRANGGTATYGMQALETSFAGGGDFEIVAAVRGVEIGATANLDAGIFIRNDSIVYALFHIFGSSYLIRSDDRLSTTSTTTTIITNTTASVVTDSMWYKVSRSGSTLSFYFSLDGLSWVLHSAATDSSVFSFTGFFSELRSASGTTIVELDSFDINF